jgi:hypothetical protein
MEEAKSGDLPKRDTRLPTGNRDVLFEMHKVNQAFSKNTLSTSQRLSVEFFYYF